MKTGHKRLWRIAMASGLLITVAQQANAQVPYLHARWLAAVDYLNPDPNGPTQTVQTANHTALGPTFSPQTAQVSAAASGGAGSGSSRADFGSLGVYALASTSNPGGTPENGVRQSASSGQSSWADRATVDGLGQFALVDIQVNLVVNVAAFSIAASPWANTGAILSFTAHSKQWCVSMMSNLSELCGVDSSPLLIGRNESSFVVQAYSGNSVTFGADMSASVVVASYSQTHQFASSALVDAMNSAYSYYTVLTPGATLSWASGHDYSLPAVPEPATWATLLAGLGVLGLRRRKVR